VLIALALAVAAAAVAVARGGSLDRLAHTRFIWLPFLLIGLAIQIVYSLLPLDDLSEGRARIVILSSFALVIAFFIANAKLPGMAIAAVGLALNIVVIALNGAMPVSIAAAESAGVSTSFENAGVKHEASNDDTALPFLGDVIPLPGLKEVISIGDIVLALGIAWLVYRRTSGGGG
jgi:Family of unknown function (DUF5317)